MKTCLKCGYTRQATDTAPEIECPKCGAIYSKVEAAFAAKSNFDANQIKDAPSPPESAFPTKISDASSTVLPSIKAQEDPIAMQPIAVGRMTKTGLLLAGYFVGSWFIGMAVLSILGLAGIVMGRGTYVPFALLTTLTILTFFPLKKIFLKYKAIKLQEREARNKILEEIKKKDSLLGSMKNHNGTNSFELQYLGGSGNQQKAGNVLAVSVAVNSVHMLDIATSSLETIVVDDILSIDISGPGTVVTNAGIIGGGFGLEGALKGIVTAAVINTLTTNSSTNSFIRIMTDHAEYFLHSSKVDPEILRNLFSPLFVRLQSRSHNKQSIAEPDLQIEKLHKLMTEGILTPEEFNAAKLKLLGIPAAN